MGMELHWSNGVLQLLCVIRFVRIVFKLVETRWSSSILTMSNYNKSDAKLLRKFREEKSKSYKLTR
jgi:hypothetical protein